MKRVVVTGSSGFTGGAMANFLRKGGIDVLCLQRADFYGVEIPLPNERTVATSLASFCPDTIFHFAGTSHTRRTADLYQSNLLTTVALFAALELVQLRPTVILCGSAAEYGLPTPDQLPISEQHVESPCDEYGASKLAQTQIGRVYASRGYPVIITRPFNLIGPGMPTRLAFGSFLEQIKSSGTSALCNLHVGNLATSRDFVLIQDAIRAWSQLAVTPAAVGKTINICSGEPTKLQSLVDWLVDAAPTPIRIVQDPSRAARHTDAAQHYGDNSLLKSLIGWAPKPPDFTDIATIVRDHLLLPTCRP